MRQIEKKAIQKLQVELRLRGIGPEELLRDRPDFGFVVKRISRSQ